MADLICSRTSDPARRLGPRFLVVGRHDDLRRLLVSALRRLGCIAHGSRDLDEVALRQAHWPDAAVVVDAGAEDEGETRATTDRLLRLRESGRGGKVLVLVARPAPAAALPPELSAAADGVLGKPFELGEFERSILELLYPEARRA